jgi:hypothetical protein
VTFTGIHGGPHFWPIMAAHLASTSEPFKRTSSLSPRGNAAPRCRSRLCFSLRGNRFQSRVGKIEQVRFVAEAAVQKQFGPSSPFKIALSIPGAGVDLSCRGHADEHQHTDVWSFTHVSTPCHCSKGALIQIDIGRDYSAAVIQIL